MHSVDHGVEDGVSERAAQCMQASMLTEMTNAMVSGIRCVIASYCTAAATNPQQRAGNTPAAAARPARGLAGEEAALAELEAAVSSVQQLHDATAGLRWERISFHPD